MHSKAPGSRDLNRTREKILAAALAEFSAKGLAGARVDRIARRARVNKRMLYYCFGAKHVLYREVLRRKIDERASFLDTMPDNFSDALVHMYRAGGNDLDFARLMEWEAIDSGHGRLIGEAERKQLFEMAIARLRRHQRAGFLPRGLDLTQLFISMIALAIFPLVMPQMIRLITGLEPTDKRFQRQRMDFMRWLGARVGGTRQNPPRDAAVAVSKTRRGAGRPRLQHSR